MFHHAIGPFIECEDPEGFQNDSQFRLKQRRGAKPQPQLQWTKYNYLIMCVESTQTFY